MKIFISSVRAGLETERDALPGLIKALRHEPLRFEDFTAQPVPSRQACIEGVEASDAYLLLLGPHYGHVFPETGQSATQDEWVTAARIGLPRYVFRKTGIEFDVEQGAFEKALGDYGSGRFYKTFTNVAELQQAVAAALRELESSPNPLSFHPLTEPVQIQWLTDPNSDRGFSSSDKPRLEVHFVPQGEAPLSGRLLEQLLQGLPQQVRGAGLLSPTEALSIDQGQNEISLTVPAVPGGRWGESYGGSLASVTVDRDGHIAVSFRLPGDQMGSIIDPQDVTTRIASALRLAGQVDLTGAEEVAVGVGLTSSSMVTVGKVSAISRNSGSISMTSDPVRVEPDEKMTRAALDRGADEVATILSRALLRQFDNRH